VDQIWSLDLGLHNWFITGKKKSNVEGTAEGLAGWEANRSTSVCKSGHKQEESIEF
jgi:hypothetical protein